MGRSSTKNWPTTNLINYTPLPVQESLKVALNIPVDQDEISFSLKKGFESIEPKAEFDQKDQEYPLLCFDANFECGNLGGAEVITQAEYNLEIRQDTNSNKYRLWYYFSVSNFIKNQTTLFNITNFSKTKSLYKNGQSPIYKFGSSGNWKRLNPSDSWYTKNDSDNASTLSFLFKFPDDNEFIEATRENLTTPKMPYRNNSNHKFNTLFSSQYGNFEIYSPKPSENTITISNDKKVYFAYCYPYTFTRLQNLLSRICSCSKYSDILERELVSMTAKQRRVDLLTITSPSNFQKLLDIERKGKGCKEKKILSKSSEPKLTSVKTSNKKRTLSRNSAREPIRCKECGTIESNKQSFRLLPTTLATSLGICTLCNSSKIRRSFSQSNIIRHDQLMDTINDRLYNVGLNKHNKVKSVESSTPSVNGSKITLAPAASKSTKTGKNKNSQFDKLNLQTSNRFHGSLSSLTDNKTNPVFNSHLTPTKPYLPIVFVSARVHPGETPSSFAMENFIKYLLSNEAKNLRKVTVFKIIPMLNPDGVFAGNYRTSTLGYDLNRCYVDPSAWAMPEIYGVRDIVEKYLSGERIKNKMPEKKEKGKGKRKKDCISVSGANIPHSVEMLREQLRIPPFKSKSSQQNSKKDRNFSNLSHLQPRTLPKVVKPESRAKLELYIDIHGHSGLSNSFMYGNIYEDDVELSISQHILPNILEKLSQDFSLNNTTFNNENCKSGSARRAFEDYKNLLCYTLEISMSHYFGKYNSDAIFYTEKRYNTIGTNLARAIEHYFCIRKPGRKSITRSSLSPSKSLVL